MPKPRQKLTPSQLRKKRKDIQKRRRDRRKAEGKFTVSFLVPAVLKSHIVKLRKNIEDYIREVSGNL